MRNKKQNPAMNDLQSGDKEVVFVLIEKKKHGQVWIKLESMIWNLIK